MLTFFCSQAHDEKFHKLPNAATRSKRTKLQRRTTHTIDTHWIERNENNVLFGTLLSLKTMWHRKEGKEKAGMLARKLENHHTTFPPLPFDVLLRKSLKAVLVILLLSLDCRGQDFSHSHRKQKRTKCRCKDSTFQAIAPHADQTLTAKSTTIKCCLRFC